MSGTAPKPNQATKLIPILLMLMIVLLIFGPKRLPGLGRRYSRRMAKGADLHDEEIRVGGSGGDRELVTLRGDSDS